MVVHLPLKLNEKRPRRQKTWFCSHFSFCLLGERSTTGNQVKKALESSLKQALPGASFRLEEMSVEELMRTKETIEDLIAEKEMQEQSITVETGEPETADA